MSERASEPMSRCRPLVMGAVAYDAKVVTIWEGFLAHFARRGLVADAVFYTNYERQVEALIAGHVDVAWNSPLAWVRARRLGDAAGLSTRALAMRDTDRDLTSVILVRSDAALTTLVDLRGRRVAVGAVDSPQATLLPLSAIRAAGLVPGRDVAVTRNDLLVGKHGDHIGGERAAARALAVGEVDAACILDANHLLFVDEGTLAPGSTRVLGRTNPYDHCNFTACRPHPRLDAFVAILLAMSYSDPDVRPLLDLEGLKAWRAGRTDGYAALERAVDEERFYDERGAVTAADYRL